MGNWIGREGKGGQAWLTYAPSLHKRFELSYRRAKLAKDFIPGGGTQNDLQFAACWQLNASVQSRVSVQVERWMIPALGASPSSNLEVHFELHWSKVLAKF